METDSTGGNQQRAMALKLDGLDGIIFDCDGVLVDSESSWLEVVGDIGAARGRCDLDRAPYRGLTVMDAAIKLAAELGEAVEPLRSELAVAFSAELRVGVPTMPGAVDLVRALAGRIPLGVASNSSADDLESLLGASGLRPLFEIVASADDVVEGKPNPALYLEAARRLGIDPTRCLAIEDSPVGSRAAMLAGMRVVGVNADPSVELEAHYRLASCNDVAELLELTEVRA